MNSDYVPKGYEVVGFFGRNSNPFPGQETPYEAAQQCAALFEKAHIDESADGWTVSAKIDIDLSVDPMPQHVIDWLNMPFEQHLERWRREGRFSK